MSVAIQSWIDDVRDAMDDGIRSGVLYGLYYAFVGLWLTVSTRFRFGTPIYEREWDLLLVLDACRVDALREVAPEFEFIESVDDIWSVGSSSHEWLCKTFTREYLDDIQETAYVSTNPNTPPTFRDGVRPPRTYPRSRTIWSARNAPEPDYRCSSSRSASSCSSPCCSCWRSFSSRRS